MNKSSIRYLLVLAMSVSYSGSIRAGELSFPFHFSGLFHKSSTDVHSYECDQCGQIHGPDTECIERVPVNDCVVGKKKVYDSSIRYEYVSIPEIRYRWKKMWVTREIDAEYQKPVCKSKDGQHCYGTEHWDKDDQQCSSLHCRSIEPRLEKTTCKHCGFEPGTTTIKVRYKTCVKVPYTVYRQVKRPIYVKEPRYEKVKVPITRHECRKVKSECAPCQGSDCNHCTP